MPVAYLFDAEFSWGFQAKIAGFSKTSPSFYYPPPTTILGAVAEAIAREHRLGEQKGRDLIPVLSRKLLAIGVMPLNFTPIKYEDINRIVAVKVTSGVLYPDPADLAGSFDSPATGKTAFSTHSDRDEAPTLRVVLVFETEEIGFEGKTFRLSENVFWKIHRLGTKESIVSVVDVKEKKNPGIEKDEANMKTKYSFPLMSGVSMKNVLEDKWELENYLNPFGLIKYDPLLYHDRGNLLTFAIPIKPSAAYEPEYQVGLAGDKVLYVLGEDERVVGLWRGS